MSRENQGNTNNGGVSRSDLDQKLRGAAKVVHGVGENWRGRLMDVVEGNTEEGQQRPEIVQGREEVEQGMAMIAGESTSNVSQNVDQNLTPQYPNASLGGAATTWGAAMPPPVGASSVPQTQYQDGAEESQAGFNHPNAGSSNNKEFEHRPAAIQDPDGVGFNSVDSAPGPAPDRTETGLGAGAPRTDIQHLG